MRRRISRRASRRSFTNSARRVKRRNVTKRLKRGGYMI